MMKVFGGIFWIGLLIGLFVFASGKGTTPPGVAVPATNAITPAAAESTASAMPGQPKTETDFVNIVEAASAAYDGAANDMAKGGIFTQRNRDICALLKKPGPGLWTGIVDQLSSNGDGKGILSIRIGATVRVRTWNNAFSDADDHTLIATGSKLFTQASTLRVGQAVIFEGGLLTNPKTCVREQSITMDGAMHEPDFLMRFTSVRPVP